MFINEIMKKFKSENKEIALPPKKEIKSEETEPNLLDYFDRSIEILGIAAIQEKKLAIMYLDNEFIILDGSFVVNLPYSGGIEAFRIENIGEDRILGRGKTLQEAVYCATISIYDKLQERVNQRENDINAQDKRLKKLRKLIFVDFPGGLIENGFKF